MSCCQKEQHLQKLGPPKALDGMLYDECFRREVESRRWYFVGDPGYLATKIDGRNIKMHNFIWNLYGRPLPDAPLTIDHANRNKLDNRLENLRIATPSLQAMNSHRPKQTSSLPRGVCRQNSGAKPYQAQIGVRNKRVSLGYFATPEEASAAYEKKREELMSLELSLSYPESHQ